MDRGWGIFGGALAVIAGIFGLTVFFGSWYTIDQKQRGVLLRNGKIVGMAQPGLGFKLPLIDDVEKISVENKLARWEKLEGYSHDQQASHYMISVNYQIAADRITDVYALYGGEAGVVSRVIAPNVLKHSKIVIGQFTAQTSIQDRGRLNDRILESLQTATANAPVTILSANVEDITFGPEYMKSINDRMVTEVQVQTLRQTLEKERVTALITVTKAQAKADSTVAEAKAEADAIKLKGSAEAVAIEARAKALGQNPNLVTYLQAERWNGVLPATMVPGGALPMLNLTSK